MTRAPTLGVLIVAAGFGLRFGDAGKALAPLAGRPLLAWSLSLFASLSITHEIVVVAGEHTLAGCESMLAGMRLSRASIVCGGDSRVASVRSGLAALSRDVTHVAVHDAARPLVTAALVQRVVNAAFASGAAVPVVPVSDTLHEIDADGLISATPDRAKLRAAQTPQVARRDWLERACQSTTGTTDDGGLLQAAGYPVQLVDGDPSNLKVTWPSDIVLAEALLAARERTI